MKRLVLGLALALLAAPATASASTTLTSGRLVNDLGTPTSGEIRVYAVPLNGGVNPLIGATRAAPDGTFTVKAADPRQLVRLSREQDGYLDWVAVADTGTLRGEYFTTTYIDRRGRSISPYDVDRGVVAAAASFPRLTIEADRPVGARASQGRCVNKRVEEIVERFPAWVVVGELNHGYNDGSSARFAYGRGGHSATWIQVAYDFSDGLGLQAGKAKFASFQGKTTFPTVRRRYARQLRTVFQFTHKRVRNNSCAVWDHYYYATDWLGNQDTSRKLKGTLNRCDKSAFLGKGWGPGADFETSHATAIEWTRGVTIKGFGLNTQSGFDSSVAITYKFRGKKGKQHYICGPNGRQGPSAAARIFSGALR